MSLHRVNRTRRHSWIVRAFVCVGCLLVLPVSIFAADTSNDSAFRISGWSEIVQSVTDLEQHRDFLVQVAGWETLFEGPVDPSLLAAWNLPADVRAKQALMGNPGTTRGRIRLVRFDDVEAIQIRSNAQTWESGGILDINVRVADMESNFREFQDRGWHAYSDPIQYRFGPFEVKEWITVGPDGLSFALIERIEPPLEGWPQMRDISRAFNSTQVVADMPAALSFYQDVLGFQKYMYWKGSSENPGPNVLGLPHELTTEIEREVWILHPQGINEGSVELVKFHGLSGRDLSGRAVPPNLGMLMLRFPVSGLDAFADHLSATGIEPENTIQMVRLSSGEQIRQLSIRAPDGAWLDFYETIQP